MKKLKNFMSALWSDEEGQGMAEYVLLLVVIVAVVAIFKDKIKTAMTTKLGTVSDSIQNFSGE